MARIIKTIEIEGQQATALFDTGALYTYARSYLVTDVPRIEVPNPPRVALGREIIEIQELCFIRGKIEGLDFVAEVVPVAELGQADGHELDALIGARTMEQWEIRLDPRTGTLDPSTGSGQAWRGSGGANSPNSRSCSLVICSLVIGTKFTMYREHTIAVVVPAYNEEVLIGRVIETMPDYMDQIVVVDNAGKDEIAETVRDYAPQMNEWRR